MASTSKSGIQTDEAGASFIPSSKRADGSLRKEIRVRPGYRPPEDVETYKNRSAEAWKTRGLGGVPGAEPIAKPTDDEPKSKNAKRREAARRKAVTDTQDYELSTAMKGTSLAAEDKALADWSNPDELATNPTPVTDGDAEKQKKIRNALKKLNAVRELKDKKSNGDKLSPDQLVKISKEEELLRDLKKLGYDGAEVAESTEKNQNGSQAVVGTG